MPAQSKREHLVNTAISLFKQSGINATGVDKIIAHAKVSKKTLYNHFRSKDELILAALRKDDEKGRHAMMQFVEKSGSDPTQQLISVFDFYEMWFNDSKFVGCFFINTAAEVSMRNPEIRRMCGEHKILIESYITKLAEKAGASRPEHLARQLNLLLEGATIYAHVVGDKKAVMQAKELGIQIIETELAQVK